MTHSFYRQHPFLGSPGARFPPLARFDKLSRESMPPKEHDIMRSLAQWFEDNDPGNKRYLSCVSSFIDVIADHIGGIISWQGDRAEDLCQSEIEKLFFVAWMLHLEITKIFGSSAGGPADHHVEPPNHASPDLDGYQMPAHLTQFDVVIPQYATTDYRADFAIRRFERDRSLNGKTSITTSPKVLVECDGHDYHERTKQQAQHDKLRDRKLQSAGFYVLRFTGSELFKNAGGCALQVNEFLEEHMSRTVIQRRHDRQNRNQR